MMTKKPPSDNWQLADNAIGKPLDRAKLRKVALNADGNIIGDGHHRCKISDATVSMLRRLYESPHSNLTPTQLAEHFELSVSTVQEILKYRRRADVPRDWRRVDDGE